MKTLSVCYSSGMGNFLAANAGMSDSYSFFELMYQLGFAIVDFAECITTQNYNPDQLKSVNACFCAVDE